MRKPWFSSENWSMVLLLCLLYMLFDSSRFASNGFSLSLLFPRDPLSDIG